jgi:hypothetical protein
MRNVSIAVGDRERHRDTAGTNRMISRFGNGADFMQGAISVGVYNRKFALIAADDLPFMQHRTPGLVCMDDA